MTTPCSGQISFSDISFELDRPRNAQLDFDDNLFRVLIKNTVKRSQVKISDAYCRKGVDPGQVSFGPGTHSWTVQNYINLTFDMYAGGGGGGGGHGNDNFAYGYNGGAGTAGGDSSALGAGAQGGGGGGGSGGRGYDGGGYNGTVSVGAGGAGGAGGGPDGGAGGNGGYCRRVWNNADPGAPAWQSVITIYVGGGGSGGPHGESSGGNGSPGGNGGVTITWGY